MPVTNLSSSLPTRLSCLTSIPSHHTTPSATPAPPLTQHLPSILSQPHLWDVHLHIMLVAAVPVLSHVPVSIDQVPVEPEQGLCVVEVSEDLLLGHVHVQVL